MFLLTTFTSKLGIHLLIFQLIIALLLLLGIELECATTVLIYTTMPVTTRSRTKRLNGSSSYTGFLSSSNTSSTGSLVELSHVYATDSS
jgi:hypothetical protein